MYQRSSKKTCRTRRLRNRQSKRAIRQSVAQFPGLRTAFFENGSHTANVSRPLRYVQPKHCSSCRRRTTYAAAFHVAGISRRAKRLDVRGKGPPIQHSRRLVHPATALENRLGDRVVLVHFRDEGRHAGILAGPSFVTCPDTVSSRGRHAFGNVLCRKIEDHVDACRTQFPHYVIRQVAWLLAIGNEAQPRYALRPGRDVRGSPRIVHLLEYATVDPTVRPEQKGCKRCEYFGAQTVCMWRLEDSKHRNRKISRIAQIGEKPGNPGGCAEGVQNNADPQRCTAVGISSSRTGFDSSAPELTGDGHSSVRPRQAATRSRIQSAAFPLRVQPRSHW